jgi:hypothetical protein
LNKYLFVTLLSSASMAGEFEPVHCMETHTPEEKFFAKNFSMELEKPRHSYVQDGFIYLQQYKESKKYGLAEIHKKVKITSESKYGANGNFKVREKNNKTGKMLEWNVFASISRSSVQVAMFHKGELSSVTIYACDSDYRIDK